MEKCSCCSCCSCCPMLALPSALRLAARISLQLLFTVHLARNRPLTMAASGGSFGGLASGPRVGGTRSDLAAGGGARGWPRGARGWPPCLWDGCVRIAHGQPLIATWLIVVQLSGSVLVLSSGRNFRFRERGDFLRCLVPDSVYFAYLDELYAEGAVDVLVPHLLVREFPVLRAEEAKAVIADWRLFRRARC